jgi:hypothetical protein
VFSSIITWTSPSGAYRGTGARGTGSRRGPPRFPSPPPRPPRAGARDSGSGGTTDGRGGHSVANNSPARRFRFGRWPQKWWSASTGLLLVRFPGGNVAGTRSGRGDVSPRAGRGPLPGSGGFRIAVIVNSDQFSREAYS